MPNELGVTQWTVPWGAAGICSRAGELGISALHLDLGSAAKGYPMMSPENRETWLFQTEKYSLKILSLALNDLCNHGFTAGLKDTRSEISLVTMKNGIATACSMKIPSVSVPHFFANRMESAADFDASVEALRYLCDLAADNGIQVYTENVLDAADLNRLWNAVDRENLRLLFDSQNYAAMGQVDAAEVFRQWQPYCGDYLHLKDGDGSLGNRSLWQGSGNFERVFTAITESRYQGAMILESNYAKQEDLQADLNKIRLRME